MIGFRMGLCNSFPDSLKQISAGIIKYNFFKPLIQWFISMIYFVKLGQPMKFADVIDIGIKSRAINIGMIFISSIAYSS